MTNRFSKSPTEPSPHSFVSFLFLLIIGSCLLIAIWFASCKNPAAPPDDHPSMRDTTSQDWVFSPTEVLGPSGVLSGAFLLNDTLGFAVGNFFTDPSDTQAYNLAKWNGSTWEPLRATVLFPDSLITPTLYEVFAFSSSEIWLLGGTIVIYGDGSSWTVYDPTSFCHQAWGTSPTSMYFAGTNATVTYFDGISWTYYDGGITTLHLVDIWGSFNETTNQWEILTLGSNSHSGVRILLKFGAGGLSSVGLAGVTGEIKAVWFDAGFRYFVGGENLYKKDLNLDCPSNPCWQENEEGLSAIESIRGNTANDVFVGGNQFAAHFNGVRWRHFDVGPPQMGGLAMRNNTVLIVGGGIGPAFTVGRRQ